MSVLKILKFPDPRLRTVAQPIKKFDQQLRIFADDMLHTMYEAPGIGLAATQVNVHIQLLVIDVSESKDQPLVLANPELEICGEKIEAEEGCLSLPAIYEKVSRQSVVKVSAQDLNGKEIHFTSEGLLGICIQHEVDHLDGVLFNKRTKKIKNKDAKLIRKIKSENANVTLH